MAEENEKLVCQRCGKKLSVNSFYTYKDGSKCEICKPCLTAHIDNFNPQTFEWILKKMDVPYIPTEWNVLRDKAFNKDPLKMNGMSVIGKYLAKMKLKQFNHYCYADTPKIQEELEKAKQQQEEVLKRDKEQFEAELKTKLDEGEISLAEYQTLVSTETQNKQLQPIRGNVITGEIPGAPTAAGLVKNPFQQQNFMSQDELIDPGAELDQQDKLYLAMKWGRLYTPSQWVTLEKLYKQFMSSFDIQGAARIDTLKMICKTSLKMNEAIDSGDIDTYQKLNRVYDSMMKSAKFTEAQNKQKDGDAIDSASAIVDFVQAHAGQIPKYECNEPLDIVDKIIVDLKAYTKSLIYEDKSLAQEIEKFLQDKRISEQMRRDKKNAEEQGLNDVELQDEDYVQFKQLHTQMEQHDQALNEQLIEEQFKKRRLNT